MKQERIKDNIAQVLAKLNLRLIGKSLEQINFSHHTFYSSVKRKGDKKIYFFKYLIIDDPYKQKTFKYDALSYKFFTRHAKELKLENPDYVDSSLTKNKTWLLRESVEGKIFGDRLYFSSGFYTKNRLNQLRDLVDSIQSLTKEASSFFKGRGVVLEKRTAGWFKEGFKNDRDFSAFYVNIEKKLLGPKIINKINLLINKNKKLLNKNLALTHGDIHAENLLIKGKKISLIDWENIHLNNHLFDWGYIWMNAWNNKSWRRELERDIIKTKTDQLLFKIDKIRWLVRMIGLLDHGEGRHQKEGNIVRRGQLNKIKNIHLKDLFRIVEER